MSEDFKPEYKIFEDINLENNKIINVSEISSYDGSGKYSDEVKNSGLYIHTPGNPTSLTPESFPSKDKGLIMTTGHAQTYLDTVDNVSNTINSTVKTRLNIKSETKTDFVSPDIDIKSADSPNTEILIKNVSSSDNDEGITVTTNRTKIVSSTSKNKTTKYSSDSNVESTILDFSSSVPSHIDLDRADIYQANTEVFVAGTKYGYSSDIITDAEEKEIYESDDKKGNALYVDPEKVNIYVDTTIKNGTTDITGKLVQTGAVEINKGVYSDSNPSTTIDGSSLDINTKTVNIGNLTSESIDVKTTNINIGTAKTDLSNRNTINIGSDYSNLTIKGRDFLIDSEDDNLYNDDYNKEEHKLSDDSYKSYLRSYYTNSNNSYVNDLLTIGPNTDITSHLELDGYANITGNLDVDGNIDVKDTLYLHSSGSEDTTTSYVKSNTDNESLQINNDTEIIISNAPNNGNDPNQISIKDTEIKTKKNLNLDSDLSIAGKIVFDSEDSPHSPDVNLIEHLNDINTQSLKISNVDGDNTVLSINTDSDDNLETFSVDAKTLSLTSVNGNDSKTTGTINIGRLKQTGNTYINTEDTITNELLVKGSNTSIESDIVNIRSELPSDTDIVNIGNSTSRPYGTSVTIKGKNDFELISGDTESKITVDKVAISNASNNNKINIYWDPVTSTLVFEKE